MKKIHIAILSGLYCGMAASPLYADFYIGAGVGSADYDVNLQALGGGDYEENGTGTKLYAGYAFNKYFAAEAGIYNFAEASAGAVESGPGTGVFNSAEASMKGLSVYAVGSYPVTREVHLMAKLGMLQWDADLQVNDASASNDGTDVAYSLGIAYAFTKELKGVAEWESFDTDNPELSMLSVGFRFDFK